MKRFTNEMDMLFQSGCRGAIATKDFKQKRSVSSGTRRCMVKSHRWGFVFGSLVLGALLLALPKSANSDNTISLIKPTQEMLFSPCERRKVTSDGILFSADCWDFDKKIPTPRDRFTQVTGGFAEMYDESGRLLKEGDLQTFIDDGDLVIQGTGTFSHVRIRATRATGYCQVQFKALTLAGPSDATNFTSTKRAFLENVDSYTRAYQSHMSTFRKLVADGSRFSKSYARSWQQSLWYANKYGADIQIVQQRISDALLRRI